MLQKVQKLRVFVASPGDVRPERDLMRKVIDELNVTIGPYKNCVLELVRWESHCHPEMGRAQAIINEQIGTYDIFIGIMWKRFGSPNGEKFNSGTEEEFRIAYDTWLERGVPWIKFYFKKESYRCDTQEEIQQLLQVHKFRNELRN